MFVITTATKIIKKYVIFDLIFFICSLIDHKTPYNYHKVNDYCPQRFMKYIITYLFLFEEYKLNIGNLDK